jgi:hypothetical protein
VKNIIYNGPKLVIKADGIILRKRNLRISYPEITSITIRKARLTRGWLGLIFLGVLLDIGLVYLLYHFLVNYYDLQDLRGYSHYSRRGSGMVIGFLLVIPIFITYRITRYFTKPLMLIIKWQGGEFRMKFSDLGISVGELKSYLDGKVLFVMRDA